MTLSSPHATNAVACLSGAALALLICQGSLWTIESINRSLAFSNCLASAQADGIVDRHQHCKAKHYPQPNS